MSLFETMNNRELLVDLPRETTDKRFSEIGLIYLAVFSFVLGFVVIVILRISLCDMYPLRIPRSIVIHTVGLQENTGCVMNALSVI
jgi:hypothetical protein